MKIYLNEETECAEAKIDLIYSFGGEIDIDDMFIREYGVQIGDLTLSDITPEEYKNLGISIINHLMANGHKFEFIKTQDGTEIRSIP